MADMQLSWDLHVHPGPSSVARWGDSAAIQAAARRAGLKGFVWKSHDSHTAKAAAALASTPVAIGSASLNAWATPESVTDALADGARWVWGPTYFDGRVAWDLPLPRDWASFAALLRDADQPLVIATGHMDAEGRRSFATLAARAPQLLCSITHSLYLAADEAVALRDLGAVFEVDLFTATQPIMGRPKLDLAAGVEALRAAGATVYLTTDCGQPQIGDPYEFSAKVLASLADRLDEGVLREIAIANPDRVVGHLSGRPVR